MSETKMTDEGCQKFYKAIMSESCKDKWIIDSPVGKQIANWLLSTSRKEQSTVKVNMQFEPFCSPVDGTEIRCRRGLREHERKHGIRQVGDDIKIKGDK